MAPAKSKAKKEVLPLETQEILTRGLTEIMDQNNRGNVSTAQYMQLYSCVYKLCTKTGSSLVGTSMVNKIDDTGFPLYEFIRNVITDQARTLLCRVSGLTGVTLLQMYNQTWSEYLFHANVINGAFQYFNRHWIKRKVDNGTANVYEMYNLAVKCWEDALFGMICPTLTKAIIELIEKERNGEIIVTSLISNALSSYLEMGINVQKTEQKHRTSNNKSLHVYETAFEQHFLKATKVYYKNESRVFVQNNSIVEYIRKVDSRIKEEKSRVERYLDKSTLNRLIDALDETLIKDYIERFKSEFNNLIRENAVDDLQKIYALCSRVPESLEALRVHYQNLIIQIGNDSIKNLQDPENNPREYIQTILDNLKRFNTVTSAAFNNEQGFVKSFDQGCIEFINKNSVCKDGQDSYKSSELLSRYCDLVLRKSSSKTTTADQEIEDVLNQVMNLFKFIDDKDVFQKYYAKVLAKRLVYDMSANEDYETSFIHKLKTMCGFEYTARFQRMFTDVSLSKDLSSGYKQYVDNKVKDKSKPDMSIMVLAEGVWPFQATDTFNIPPQLTDCMAEFTSFYTGKYTGRKLTFLTQLSRGEIICNWPRGRRFTFITTVLQMSILLLYNDRDEMTLDTMMKSLNVKKDHMLHGLQALLKIEILKLEGAKFNANIDLSTKCVINPQFTSKKIRVDLSKSSATRNPDAKKESESIQKGLEEDRKFVIQAAIVRVMKMRKEMKHSSLISEVITLLTIRFNPNVKMIKKCIDILIEKEYIRRSEKERDVYEYIS